jgi:hypothetical protein
MPAYYVEWHMRQTLAPMLFDDDDKPADTTAAESLKPAQGKIVASTAESVYDLPDVPIEV